MKRRQFIQIIAGSVTFLPATGFAAGEPASRYFPGRVRSSSGLAIAQGKRLPFGWKSESIAGGTATPLLMEWPDLPADARPTALRVAVALDERDEKTVECFLPASGRILGEMVLRFPAQFQVYELTLTSVDLADVRGQGIGLRMTKGSPLETFVSGEDLPPALAVHLMEPGRIGRMEEFYQRLGSIACVQPFGWMEGCVLDGLHDLASLAGRASLLEVEKRHLALFFKNGRLVYENHTSVASDGKLYGIEGGLPFAALARLQPDSPLLDTSLGFWRSRMDAEGAVIDGSHTSSEGCYTVAYPLALIGLARGDEQLQKLALTQLRVRQQRLFDGQTFWRTSDTGDPPKLGNRNWARGVAWQLLGFAHTLRVLKDRKDMDDLRESFKELSAWAIQCQQKDGLWSVFTDELTLPADTGGSAGIGAALAIGAQQGWLGPDAGKAAAKTLAGLQNYLTADGFLGGVSQANKGGEALQRGQYRVIYQMAMGLMAQLIAALGK